MNINELKKQLEHAKKDFLREYGNISVTDSAMLQKEMLKGNMKAIAMVNWLTNVEKTYLMKIKQIDKGEIDAIFDFNSMGYIPFLMSDIYADKIDFDNIIIVEVNYNPYETNVDKNWIAIYNPTKFDINLKGYSFQKADANFSTFYTFPDTILLGSGKYFILSGEKIVNLSHATNGLRIVDEKGYISDTILYDIDNGSVNNFAPKIKLGSSLKRVKENGNYIDTDDCGADFKENVNPDKSIYI